MNRYQLEFREGVRSIIDHGLPGNIKQRVLRILRELRTNPRPAYVEEMRDELSGCYKVSLGAWRLIYEVENDVLVVLVLKVGRKSGPEFYHDIRR